ncbi:cyclin dependent kinase binding protein, putative [Plasmodium gallinaceum]|uniref:Cyclin dependent kinase binding protein, putative n=1 Tax=Plasmodium gallinaceum TaxID=5849 RepID=A0A1J1GMS2_PLAGA|nr:cyclin dependent kinase binding protein, putative [Plasmodium gallinaceum]CRG93635.1 cyclin dependent kinase binding protein, putative [Plasmodium gallinaceum]
MKKINYFSIYEDFFKDANNFLNTIETKNNFFDYSSESSADNKNERNDCTNNKNGEYADFYINVESNKVTFKSDLLENEKKKNNNNYTNIKFSSRILLCYKNTHSLCLSYKPYNENTCNDSSNVNNSISILKKKNSNFDDKGEEYNLKKKNENKILNFLYKWILPLKKDDANVLKETKKKIKNKDIITKKVDDERNIHSDKKKKKFYNLNNNNLNITTKKTEENIKKDQNINEIKKRKKGKKGISYEHLLKPSRYDYDAFCLFNPRFKQGKHHTVMYLQSYNVSIIPFVKPKKLKEKVNELFSEINPWIHKSLTLSKLRNLKIDLFNLINFIPEIDISTISCAWVFFERLVIKGYVHKFNRKLYAATCLILSLKFYQHDDIQILEKLLSYIQKLDKKENLTPSLIFSVEFLVYRLLDFSLQHTYENIRPHIHQYLESKELKFEDVYGISEDAYLCSNYASKS